MKNYIFGYARVSTEAQNLDRQLDALKKYGVDQIYNEKMTGTKRDRPELAKLLDRMTEGDVVVIESLSRLGRSTKDLIELTELFNSRGVNLVSLKEAIDTSTPTGKLLFNTTTNTVNAVFACDGKNRRRSYDAVDNGQPSTPKPSVWEAVSTKL